jgi:flagellar hook-basal body complex protein FliE
MSITPVRLADTAAAGVGTALRSTPAPAAGPFTKVIDHLLGQANQLQAQADQAVQELALGKTDDLHRVLLAVSQADLSFRLILEIRNRLTDAFQEVTRMQV